MPNSAIKELYIENLDKQLMLTDCYGRGTTLVASEETLKYIFELNEIEQSATYKGHLIMINNDIPYRDYIILDSKGVERYATK